MKPWIAIWRQSHRGSRRTRYVGPLLWLVPAAVSTAAFWPECRLDVESLAGIFARFAGVMVALVGLALWAGYLRSLDVQLAPAAVQLVPSLRRHAIGATLVLWLFVSGALAVELSVFGLPLVLLASALAASLALSVSARRGAALGLLSGFVLLTAPFARSVLPQAIWEVAPWKAGTLLVAAVLGGGARIARELSGTAERRFGPFARHRSLQKAVREPRLETMWSAILRRPSVYPWVFKGALRTAAPEARMLHGLGTTFHWSHAAFGTLTQTLLGGGVYVGFHLLRSAVLPAARSESIDVESILRMIVSITFIFAAFLGESLLRTLQLRKKEEALLRLLPGVPNGRDLNQWLMLNVLTRYATAVAFGLVFLLPLMLAFRVPLESALQMIAAPFGVSLLVAPALLQNYASMRLRRFPILFFATLPACVLLQIAVMSRRLALDPIAVILISVGLSALLVAVRFARFVEAPAAFPVGRLAD